MALKLDVWAPRLLSLLRLMAGLLYMQHGLQKFFGFPAPMQGMSGPLPPLLIVGATLELGGGALLAVGLFTRPVAFILSGMMAVAYFTAHAPRNFYPILNGGDLAILFCFVFLYFAAAGGGAWSIDAALARRKSEAAAG